MLKLVQNLFAAKANPIGVDFGTDCLRLAQVQRVDGGGGGKGGGEYKLIAAASCDVPSVARNNLAARMQFFVETARDLLAQGNFKGRQAVLGLPAAYMHIQHLRMGKLDEEETRKALPWEARGKIPLDPSNAVLRHVIAGEVYQDSEPRNEVILMAAARDIVNQLLAAAAKAKLDVVGMNVEPKALIDAFSQIYRRKADADPTTMYVDIGCGASRAVIARGRDAHFARAIPIGGDHFNRATAAALGISFEEAKMLRIKLCAAVAAAQTVEAPREKEAALAVEMTPATVSPARAAPATTAASAGGDADADTDASADSLAFLGFAGKTTAAAAQQSAAGSGSVVATAATPAATAALRFTPPASSPAAPAGAAVTNKPGKPDEATRVQHACAEPIGRLIEELNLCRRYYESTFQNRPVDRLVFVGGEARHRNLCQQIAQEMGLAAQVGDPLVRMGRISDIGIESGIDRRQPQPGWAVAIGLSMGPDGAGAPSSEGTK